MPIYQAPSDYEYWLFNSLYSSLDWFVYHIVNTAYTIYQTLYDFVVGSIQKVILWVLGFKESIQRWVLRQINRAIHFVLNLVSGWLKSLYARLYNTILAVNWETRQWTLDQIYDLRTAMLKADAEIRGDMLTMYGEFRWWRDHFINDIWDIRQTQKKLDDKLSSLRDTFTAWAAGEQYRFRWWYEGYMMDTIALFWNWLKENFTYPQFYFTGEVLMNIWKGIEAGFAAYKNLEDAIKKVYATSYQQPPTH